MCPWVCMCPWACMCVHMCQHTLVPMGTGARDPREPLVVVGGGDRLLQVNPKGFWRRLSWGTPRAQTDRPLHRSRSRGWPFSRAGLRAASEQGLYVPEPEPAGPPGRAWAAGRGAATSDGLKPYPRPTWDGPGLTRASGDKPVLPSRPDGSDPRGPLSRRCLFRGGDTQTPTGHRTGSQAHGQSVENKASSH